MASTPPQIFSAQRRTAARHRMLAMQGRPDAPRYLIDDMVEDVVERLGFLRHEPRSALIIGDYSGALGLALRGQGADVTEAEPARDFREDAPFPVTGFDLIVSLGTLDTINDLPGALIQARSALASGGLMIASFCGSGSLAHLRDAMLAADGERPAPRMHPMVDVRAGGQLLQRAGFADPVVDSRPLDVGFRSLDRLIADLRAQAMGNVLARHGRPLGKAALAAARTRFAEAARDGRTVERFEILTLSGWRK